MGMTKKDPTYENLYTQQMQEAVFEQRGYDAQKDKQKKALKRKNETARRFVKAGFVLTGIGLLGVVGYLINYDPSYAGPASIMLAVFMLLSGLVWFINR